MTDENNLAGEWDLSPVLKFLLSQSEGAAEAAWVDALPVISKCFPPDVWLVDEDVNTFGADAYKNLYEREGRKEAREWLESNGVTLDEFASAVGPVQYVSIQIQLRSLMQRARSNTGWRIRIMGFPSIGLIVCGLGSHYQGTQNHDQMGHASGLIRSRALEVLTDETRQELEQWPAATSEDWNARGLMPTPVLAIGDLDISSFDGGKGVMLRMVRNTTVKKDLATFFAVKGMPAEDFLEHGAERVLTLRRIAFALGTSESD